MTMIRGVLNYDNNSPGKQGIPATSPIQKTNNGWYRADTLDMVEVQEMTYEQVKASICEIEE